MKATFLFIAMLLFVNSSKDLISPAIDEIDTNLLELAKDPSSEAVFATLAIQMESKTNGGFSKVLGLLTELVHDSKSQLHSMTKLWKGVSARCQVSKIKLAGRQEFFETYLDQARRHIKHANERLAECKDHLSGLNKSENVYKEILDSEISRHSLLSKKLGHRYNQAKEGLESLKKAHHAVKEWSPKSAALIQTHLASVSKAYKQVKDFELPSVTELLERTTDTKVRRRLTEWLNQVSSELELGKERFKASLKRLRTIGSGIEKALGRMLVAIRAGKNHLAKAISYSKHVVATSKTSRDFFSKLARQNASLIASNNAYCKLERTNFQKNKILAEAGVKLFREVRDYFINHYKKIHSFIKRKYHKY